ncbi:MAG: phospholipase D family protein [Pseudomonadales bacterium]|nr:phospholipase D family protein [Pseudomonadales bacterium]
MILRLSIVLLSCLLSATTSHARSIQQWLDDNCAECVKQMPSQTGAYILEKGEEALIGRAWLTQQAEYSIDVQYFIWSSDNIGILAAEKLLAAAERGVSVRVLVDDLLVNAEDETLLMLSAHPNVQIRIYNPNLFVGVSFWRRILNIFTQFRSVNQRMHDKTVIFDGIAGITGGRNMADEYFDYNRDYNFRDRDILLMGSAVSDMHENFEEFWHSSLSIPVEKIFDGESHNLTDEDLAEKAGLLHAYANDSQNFEPLVREAINNIAQLFPEIIQKMSWQTVSFISDMPGKNDGKSGLQGGGESTSRLIEALTAATESVLIQSPYLIMPKGGIELLSNLISRGVRVRISTNSLASTDNIAAFSGYHRQRPYLLQAGVELFEFKPHPGIQEILVERYPRIAENNPVFAIHAKSMVIDGKTIFIGTFNLDPRSANLNTEVGVLIESKTLAHQLTESIERDVRTENSWQTTIKYTPDNEVSCSKRILLSLIKLLPIESIL